MEHQFFRKITVGMLDVNCFLVPVAESGKLYIIDPGDEADRIIAEAQKLNFEEAEILLTHAHVDHICAIRELVLGLGINHVRLHSGDNELYRSPENHLLPFVPAAKGLPEPSNDFTSNDYQVIHTPGHTPGSVCFYFHKMPVLFSGDTLFAGSIGRTDFPGGDLDTLLASIREKLFVLPDDLVVLPGHGPETIIGTEKKHNPFV